MKSCNPDVGVKTTIQAALAGLIPESAKTTQATRCSTANFHVSNVVVKKYITSPFYKIF